MPFTSPEPGSDDFFPLKPPLTFVPATAVNGAMMGEIVDAKGVRVPVSVQVVWGPATAAIEGAMCAALALGEPARTA